METRDIMQVTESSNLDIVNRYLKIGWELLCAASTAGINGADAYVLYSLGWSKGKGPVKQLAD
ncbi:MAG: hypothetical protein E7572_10730 [Ruminococcaceae bacterium]|jgi:hypothetical protein|nr:hypothetical protein [Oscillospiraceae bacterium]